MLLLADGTSCRRYFWPAVLCVDAIVYADATFGLLQVGATFCRRYFLPTVFRADATFGRRYSVSMLFLCRHYFWPTPLRVGATFCRRYFRGWYFLPTLLLADETLCR